MYTVKQIAQYKLENHSVMSQIWALRYRVFCEEKQWIPENPEKTDIDEFDALDVKHFACFDNNRRVVGYFRLLPTTGPYMLKDVFPVLMGGKPLPCDEHILESSRFVIDRNLAQDRNDLSNVAKVTSALLIALFEYAEKNNISAVVSVCDLSVEKILRRSGLLTTRYSAPVKIGNCLAVAGYAEPSELNINRLKENYYVGEPEMAEPPSLYSPTKGRLRM